MKFSLDEVVAIADPYSKSGKNRVGEEAKVIGVGSFSRGKRTYSYHVMLLSDGKLLYANDKHLWRITKLASQANLVEARV